MHSKRQNDNQIRGKIRTDEANIHIESQERKSTETQEIRGNTIKKRKELKKG